MTNQFGNGVPAEYEYINAYNAAHKPSTMHTSDTRLFKYFTRYLLQKAFSVFKWEIPSNWNRDYLLYVLYVWGFVAVVKTDKYGVIPQACTLRGYNIYYQPTEAVIANPLLNGIKTPVIDKQCVVLKLTPDFGGIMDLITTYADLMATAVQTAGVNMVNSKLSYIFTADNKAAAESYKKLYDNVASGEPAVVVDKDLFNDDGSPKWAAFQQNVGQNYIVDKLLADLRKIECMFNTEIGIPNANTDKKERLISDEVNANNVEVATKAELWLESLQNGCKRIREMFDVEVSVDWRIKPETAGGVENGID